MTDTSGGAYKHQTISFTSAPLARVEEVTLWDAAGPEGGQSQRFRVDVEGKLHPILDCPVPADPDPVADDDQWTCPECGRSYHMRVESWYEPDED
jgi:hypothetical protein